MPNKLKQALDAIKQDTTDLSTQLDSLYKVVTGTNSTALPIIDGKGLFAANTVDVACDFPNYTKPDSIQSVIYINWLPSLVYNMMLIIQQMHESNPDFDLIIYNTLRGACVTLHSTDTRWLDMGGLSGIAMELLPVSNLAIVDGTILNGHFTPNNSLIFVHPDNKDGCNNISFRFESHNGVGDQAVKFLIASIASPTSTFIGYRVNLFDDPLKPENPVDTLWLHQFNCANISQIPNMFASFSDGSSSSITIDFNVPLVD